MRERLKRILKAVRISSSELLRLLAESDHDWDEEQANEVLGTLLASLSDMRSFSDELDHLTEDTANRIKTLEDENGRLTRDLEGLQRQASERKRELNDLREVVKRIESGELQDRLAQVANLSQEVSGLRQFVESDESELAQLEQEKQQFEEWNSRGGCLAYEIQQAEESTQNCEKQTETMHQALVKAEKEAIDMDEVVRHALAEAMELALSIQVTYGVTPQGYSEIVDMLEEALKS